MKQISAFVENRPGRIAEITKILADSSVDLRALSIADTADFGILRMIVDNPEEVAKLLKNNGIAISLTDVVSIKLPDKPGALNSLLSLLANNDISVEYLYAFVAPDKNGAACVVVRVNDTNKAGDVLKANNYEGITSLN